MNLRQQKYLHANECLDEPEFKEKHKRNVKFIISKIKEEGLDQDFVYTPHATVGQIVEEYNADQLQVAQTALTVAIEIQEL